MYDFIKNKVSGCICPSLCSLRTEPSTLHLNNTAWNCTEWLNKKYIGRFCLTLTLWWFSCARTILTLWWWGTFHALQTNNAFHGCHSKAILIIFWLYALYVVYFMFYMGFYVHAFDIHLFPRMKNILDACTLKSIGRWRIGQRWVCLHHTAWCNLPS